MSTTAGSREQNPVAAWALSVLVVGMLAAVTGFGVYRLGLPSGEASDGFAELGAFLGGFMAAGLVLLIGWLVLVVVCSRRYVPYGRQRAAAATAIGVVGVLAAVLLGAAGALDADGAVGAMGMAVIAVLVAGAVVPPVVFELFRGRRARRR